jgi:hypothetical protein
MVYLRFGDEMKEFWKKENEDAVSEWGGCISPTIAALLLRNRWVIHLPYWHDLWTA